jgi:hypothetical protein
MASGRNAYTGAQSGAIASMTACPVRPPSQLLPSTPQRSQGAFGGSTLRSRHVLCAVRAMHTSQLPNHNHARARAMRATLSNGLAVDKCPSDDCSSLPRAVRNRARESHHDG